MEDESFPACRRPLGGNGSTRSSESPRREALLQRLQLVGFGRRRAAVYLFLLTEGPCKASDVAAGLHMPRGAAYSALKDLTASGRASTLMGRPLRFAAARPECLLDNLEAAERNKLEAIQQAKTELSADLAKLPRSCSEPARATFRILEGRSEIRRALERMLRGAQRAVKLVNTHEPGVVLGDFAPVRDVAPTWATQGITPRALMRPFSPTDAGLLPVEARAFAGWAQGSVQRFVVVDERQALLWAVNDASPRPTADDVAVWSDAEGIVRTLDALFEAAWATAQSLATASAPRREAGHVRLAAAEALVAGAASIHDGLAT